MEEVYNVLVKPEDGYINWRGSRYPLEKVIRVGEQLIYSYNKPGYQRILIVPHFAKQYMEIKNRMKSFDAPVTLVAKERAMYKFFTLKKVERSVSEDEEGSVNIYSCTYKDIRVTIQFDGKHLKLLSDFTILNHNLFGDLVSVPEIVDMSQ